MDSEKLSQVERMLKTSMKSFVRKTLGCDSPLKYTIYYNIVFWSGNSNLLNGILHEILFYSFYNLCEKATSYANNHRASKEYFFYWLKSLKSCGEAEVCKLG